MLLHIRIEEGNCGYGIELRLIELHTIRVMFLLIKLLDIDLESRLTDESHVKENIVTDQASFFRNSASFVTASKGVGAPSIISSVMPVSSFALSEIGTPGLTIVVNTQVSE